jgi:hypothetical protein
MTLVFSDNVHVVDLLLPTLFGIPQEKLSDTESGIYLYCSCLSIVGVLCEECPLALLPWLRDIITCVIGILRVERNAELKRGRYVHVCFCVY